MKIAIRADASPLIGTGHVMRCLTLADALKAKGGEVRFLARHLPEHLESLVLSKGHALVRLAGEIEAPGLDGTTHSTWLGTSQRGDAEATCAALADDRWDWIVVDHYALDQRWESHVRKLVRKIFVIDDLADRDHDCDSLLDQNLYRVMENRYDGKVPHRTELHLGPRYALLRPSFSVVRETVSLRCGPVKRVLVFLGGVDAENVSERIVDAFLALGSVDIEVDLVIGQTHPSLERLKAKTADAGYRCFVQTDRMAELMAAADLAIGASGSASWERCCLGLPSILISTAANQVAIAKGLAHVGAAVYAGPHEGISSKGLEGSVRRLLEGGTRLEEMSRRAFDLVDGQGAQRIQAYLRSHA